MKALLSRLFRRIKPIKAKGTGNVVQLPRHYSNVCVRIFGNNNKVEIQPDCVLRNTEIHIIGDNCSLIVGSKSRFLGPAKFVIENGGEVEIGSNCGIRGVSFEINNAKVTMGDRVMTSYGIIVRNHDSHKIFDRRTRHLLNPPKDIRIGNHAWIAQNVTILKGVDIGDDSVVGIGSVVTKDVPPNSVAVGVPAKVTKTDIIWDY